LTKPSQTRLVDLVYNKYAGTRSLHSHTEAGMTNLSDRVILSTKKYANERAISENLINDFSKSGNLNNWYVSTKNPNDKIELVDDENAEKIYTVNNSKGEVLLDSDTNYSNSDYLIAEYTLSKPMELGKTYTITVKGNIENEDGGLAILCDEGRYFISKSVDKISGNIY